MIEIKYVIGIFAMAFVLCLFSIVLSIIAYITMSRNEKVALPVEEIIIPLSEESRLIPGPMNMEGGEEELIFLPEFEEEEEESDLVYLPEAEAEIEFLQEEEEVSLGEF